MQTNLREVIQAANHLWPKRLADAWDSPGLAAGDPDSEATKVLLSVDVTHEVIDEAISKGCQLVFSHHPFLLKGINSVSVEAPKGSLLSKAITRNIAIFAAHTNADVVEDGVSDTIAKSLGLNNLRPLVPTETSDIGHGRIGTLDREVKLGELALALARLLPATAGGIKVSGDYESIVSKVALCGGAGDSFISAAQEAQADVYITSDLRHHPVQEAREHSPTLSLIDVSHWASESLWLQVACNQLGSLLPLIEFCVSDVRTDPWDFTVTQ